MTTLRISPAHSPHLIEGSRRLREAVLRAPWGQTLEVDTVPPDDDLVGVINNDVVATGRLLVSPDAHRARIRGMAVSPAVQRQGLGHRMLQALEERARGRGCSQLELNARNSAVGFYTQAGYADAGAGPTLYDSIPHRVMTKSITHTDYSPWDLRLRPVRDADGPALQAMIFGCLAEFGMQPEHDGIDRDLETLEATYAGGAFWVAVNEAGQIVASVGLLPLATPGHYELRRMYLAAGYRGRQLGRALLGTALHWARQHGAGYLELETATVLEAARHLYLWAGFQPVTGDLETRRCDQRMGLRLTTPEPAAA